MNKHKHILDLDDDLEHVINKDNIFASYRDTKTIKDILTHSKLRSAYVDTQEDQINLPNGECKKCNNAMFAKTISLKEPKQIVTILTPHMI